MADHVVKLPARAVSGSEMSWGERRRVNPVAGVNSIQFDVGDTLPQVCIKHGSAEIERLSYAFRFIQLARTQGQRNAVQMTPTTVMKSFILSIARGRPWNLASGSHDYNTVVSGTWPMCAVCVRRMNIFRMIGRCLLGSGALFILVYALALLLLPDSYSNLFLVLIVPSWFPVGLAFSAIAYSASRTFVSFLPIIDDSTVEVRASHAFAKALSSRECPRG